MTVEPKIEFAIEEELDHDPEINPATDYLIECKRCGELRHKSWFRVNWPACASCMKFQSLFLENLTNDLVMSDPYGIMPTFDATGTIADLKPQPGRPHRRRR